MVEKYKRRLSDKIMQNGQWLVLHVNDYREEKIIKLENKEPWQMQNIIYSIYTKTRLYLFSQKGKLDKNSYLDVLSYELQIPVKDLKVIYDKLISNNLFQIYGDFFQSKDVVDKLQEYERRKQLQSLGGKISSEKKREEKYQKNTEFQAENTKKLVFDIAKNKKIDS